MGEIVLYDEVPNHRIIDDHDWRFIVTLDEFFVKIPPNIPDRITLIEINHCNVDSIPKLPKGLLHLRISSCRLSKIENIPDGLMDLDVSDNNIEEIPRDIHVPSIDVTNNLIEVINIPDNRIKVLCAQRNPVNTVVSLGKLERLCIGGDEPLELSWDIIPSTLKVLETSNVSYIGEYHGNIKRLQTINGKCAIDTPVVVQTDDSNCSSYVNCRTLELVECDLACETIPLTVESLKIFGCTGIINIAHLSKLLHLDISCSNYTGAKLPSTIRLLRLDGAHGTVDLTALGDLDKLVVDGMDSSDTVILPRTLKEIHVKNTDRARINLTPMLTLVSFEDADIRTDFKPDCEIVNGEATFGNA